MVGNAPRGRVAALYGFWDRVTEGVGGLGGANWGEAFGHGGVGTQLRRMVNAMHAAQALMGGAPGFFDPRVPPPYMLPPGTAASTSFYDTGKLRATLLDFVDFGRINKGAMRLSLGAVNVRNGNFAYFDTTTDVIRPEHVMASGALPPGFPAVEIDGEHYWDGGLVSNTPLQWVAQGLPEHDTIAFQVDLWPAVGDLPADLAEVATRQKEIQYSSRTRQATDQLAKMQRLRAAVRSLLEKVPDEWQETEHAKLLRDAACETVLRVVHLIYRARKFEGQSKDYQFSRLSMKEHWQAGYQDAVNTLRDPAALERPPADLAVATYDAGRNRVG